MTDQTAGAGLAPLGLDDMPAALAEALAPRVARLKYLGDFFKYSAHNPDALKSFMDFTETSKSGLPERLVEVIALTVSCLVKADYERHQHERLSVRLGFGRDWVVEIERLAPDRGALLSEDERLLQRFVIAGVERRADDVQPLFAALVERLGGRAALAAGFVVGRYLTHALMVDALGLAPPVPSIFEDGFAG